MANDGYIVKLDRPHSSLDYHWALRAKGTPLPKPLELSGYEHAVMVGNMYVTFYLTGKLTTWQPTPIKHRVLEEDAKATFEFSTANFYLEIDRATEHKGVIKSKAERYMKLKETFHVIFVVPDEKRAEAVLDELPRNAGTRFLAALHDDIHRDPREQIFVSANRPADFQYLSDIISSVRTDE